MAGDRDEVPRLLRDRHIKAVRDKFHRPPTVNELRAIDALPLEPRKNLNDTSSNGQRIYELLRAFEKTGYVEGLEEAGRLLWAQVFAEPDFSQEPRREPFSAVRNIAARGINEVKYRADQHPTRTPKEKPLQWTSAEKLISINATSNAFAGSPQKPWMIRGVSISPTPRRASISSGDNGNNNEPANNHFQSRDAQLVSLRFAESGQQTQNRISTFTTPVPGGPPNTYGGGTYMPWPLHQKAQEYQYVSPYSIQTSTTSVPYVPERGEQARDIMSRANVPSNIDGESRVPVQRPISRSHYTSNLKSELTDCNILVGNLLHTHTSPMSFPSATLETNRFDQTTFSNSTPQNSHWGHRTSMMPSLENYYDPSSCPFTNRNSLRPSNDLLEYQNRQITGSTGNTYDPTSPPFHPAISVEGQQLFLLRKKEKETYLARITSNIHQSLSALPDTQGDQPTGSSSTTFAANTSTSTSTTDYRTQHASPSASMQQSPSSDTSAVPPGQSSNNPFVIRDNMGFIHQGMNFAPKNLLPLSSRRIIRSISSSTITPILPSPKTIKGRTTFPNKANHHSGMSIPENPLPGTISSIRTQNTLSVHNAKKNSTKKAFIPAAPVSAQVDGASDSASNTGVQAHCITNLSPQQESSCSSASSNFTIKFIHFDTMKDYDNDDNACTEQPASNPPTSITHSAQPLQNLFHPTPTRPSSPPLHLRPHTPDYLVFPPTAASSSKQIWPRPPPEIEGYRQYTFVRDRISLNMKAKRRTEIDLDTGDYRHSMDSQETSRGYKMDGTRIRTSSRYFHKKRVAKKSKEKMEEERVDEIARKVESVEKGVEEMRREEGDVFLELLGGGFLPL
ncbi:uncharacterized protein EAE97_010778 [Botrytis byssoidea]|uniref:Uncharacterized protein n=1 Tax=Botrytis byssoidea TaxID=139641 RepID=A0A9P5I5S7_9HELO|nr:uncharacterized protein EAE97_010778 [Botrytis byssoidea]KAF7924166.1 hypothetical protein EAE97_010778 [Botrytis byssoidea]